MRSSGEILGEAGRLAGGVHHDPHGVLGPHLDGASLVVRAWQPGADGVTLVLADGRERELRPIGDQGLFAVRLRRTTVPGYRFDVSRGGVVHPAGDPYRFAPTIGPLDLHLIGEGTHRRLWDALGARPLTSTASPVSRSRSGRRRRAASRSSATSTAGTSAGTRCAPWARPASGSCSCPTRAPATAYKLVIHGADGALRLQRRSAGPRGRGAARDGVDRRRARHVWDDDDVDGDPRRAPPRRPRRCRSTRCTSARGARRASTTASLAETLPAYVPASGSPTSS